MIDGKLSVWSSVMSAGKEHASEPKGDASHGASKSGTRCDALHGGSHVQVDAENQ